MFAMHFLGATQKTVLLYARLGVSMAHKVLMVRMSASVPSTVAWLV